MVSYAQRFAETIYKTSSHLRLPSEESINSIPIKTMRSAIEVIDWSIGIRTGAYKMNGSNGNRDKALRDHLNCLDLDSSVYKHLRRMFFQENGPSIPTLLATLPLEYLAESLQLVRSALKNLDGKGAGV